MQKPIASRAAAWRTFGYVAGLIAIALAIHWRWFRPGIITNQDWWNYTPEGLRALWPFPSAFNFASNIGADWRTNINYFPMEALVGGFGRLGIDVGSAERLGVIFPTIIIAPVAAFVFAKQYLRSNVAAFISALFYANNAYIGVIIARGQLTIAESYALVPLAAAFCVLAVRKRNRVLFSSAAAIALAWSIVCDVRIGLLGFAVTAVLALAEIRRENLVRAIQSGFYFALGLTLLLCFVWLPIVSLHLQEKPPFNYTDASWLTQLSQAWPIDLLTSYKPLWFDNELHHGPLFFLGFAPLLAVGIWKAPASFGKRRFSAFLAIFIAASVCAIGANSPFGPAYGWLFDHTWFFAMFRDPSKFYAPAMLGYAVFIGTSAEWLAALLMRRSRPAAVSLCAAIALLCIAPSSPVIDGAQHQLNDPRTSSASEKRLTARLADDPSFSRVLWGVSPDRMVPGDERHPQVDGLWFAGVTEHGSSVYSSANSLLQALHVFGVRYVVLRRDKAAGLQYAPAFEVYRTLELLARQGLFGKPLWDDKAFAVYRLDNHVAAFRAQDVPHYVIYGDLGKPGLYMRKRMHATTHDAAQDTLLTDEGAYSVVAHPELRALSNVQTGNSVRADLPDWTGYLMLKVALRKPLKHPAVVVLRGNGGTQQYRVQLTSLLNYVTLPADGFGHSVSIRLTGGNSARIEAVYGIDASYDDLIDPHAIAHAQRSAQVPMLIPFSAIPRKAIPATGFPIVAQAAPATFTIDLPHTAADERYWIPIADTPLWQVQSGVRVASEQAGALTAAVNIRTQGGRIVLACAADAPLRAGAAVSAVALAILLGCIALLSFSSLRAPIRNPITAEIVHT